MNTYDLIIIGGGPGGYVSAIRAVQLGMKVAVVEKEHLGGICLNWGCIPTKALLRCSEINHLLKKAHEYGFVIKDAKFDFDKVIKRSRKVAKQLSDGIHYLMKKNNVTVIEGTGKLLKDKRVAVSTKNGEQVLSAKNIILATGSRPRVLPGLEPDKKCVVTYKDALVPVSLPKKLLVIGSGAIGTEFASFYHNMGSKVTLVEVADRILPVEDKEVSEFMKSSFETQGIDVCVGSKVVALEKGKDSVKATIEIDGKKQVQSFDIVITAVGIQGNVENIGLENTRVKVDKGCVITNQWCETDEPGIYAIGDVAGPPCLAHKASHEGVICVEKMAGKEGVKPLNKLLIPGCTYSIPQVASVGLTEQAAREKGYKLKVGKFPFMGNGKAIAMGETEGFIKTIFDEKTGELLGAHMVGAEVTEMIQGYVVAMNLEATEQELMHTIFPHPTLSEMMQESVLKAFDKAIHI